MYSQSLPSPLRNLRRAAAPSTPAAAPSAARLPACLRNAYYLDTPEDGVSAHLLASLGVSLTYASERPPRASSGFHQLGLWSPSVYAEHSFPFSVRYSAQEGGVAVDVRDSADAWVRLLLHEGDELALAAGVYHRALRAPLCFKDLVEGAAGGGVFGCGDGGARASTTALAPHLAGRVTLPTRAGLLLFAAEPGALGLGAGGAAGAFSFSPARTARALAAAATPAEDRELRAMTMDTMLRVLTDAGVGAEEVERLSRHQRVALVKSLAAAERAAAAHGALGAGEAAELAAGALFAPALAGEPAELLATTCITASAAAAAAAGAAELRFPAGGGGGSGGGGGGGGGGGLPPPSPGGAATLAGAAFRSPARPLAALPPPSPAREHAATLSQQPDAAAAAAAAEAAALFAATPLFLRPGVPHTRALVTELCNSFYGQGWVTGTGGSISVRTGGRTFMAPSGVQKCDARPPPPTRARRVFCPPAPSRPPARTPKHSPPPPPTSPPTPPLFFVFAGSACSPRTFSFWTARARCCTRRCRCPGGRR
jgi:hypothetical protein